MSLVRGIAQPLTRGIGLAINRGALPNWTPKPLFAAGAQGAWYDPSDLSTLFQDTAGTTPVTAVGQPVGLMRDKSGRGNHASQSTTTARPTLQQDAGGRYYLRFDGVDDCYSYNGNVLVGASYTFAVASARASLGREDFILGGSTGAADSNFQVAYRATGNTLVYGQYSDDLTAPSTAITSQTSANILSGGLDTSSGRTFYGNGVLISSSASKAALVDNSGAFIGHMNTTTNKTYFAGSYYGHLCVTRALSDVDRKRVERYLANKSGVTL